MGTNWHVPTVEVDRSDPFESVESEGGSLVTYEGAPNGDKAFEELRSLIRAEGLSTKVCELKDRDWSHPTCSTCPERGTRGVLCGIGVAQERALAEYMDSPAGA